MNAFDSLRGFGPYGSKPAANPPLLKPNPGQPYGQFDENQVFQYLQQMYPDMASADLQTLGQQQMNAATEQTRKFLGLRPNALAPGQRLKGYDTTNKSQQSSVGTQQRLF